MENEETRTMNEQEQANVTEEPKFEVKHPVFMFLFRLAFTIPIFAVVTAWHIVGSVFYAARSVYDLWREDIVADGEEEEEAESEGE